MPNSRFPRVVGFEVPLPGDMPETPMVALLDIMPTSKWVAVFEREVGELTDSSGVTRVTIHEDRVSIYGVVVDRRRLADDIRALVEHISRVRLDERLSEAGMVPVGPLDEHGGPSGS